MYFHYFVIISPWKRAGLFIWTNLNPLHPRMLCAKVEIGPVVLEKKMKMWKVYGRTDGRTDRQTDRWSEKLTWAFSSGELKTKQISIEDFKRINYTLELVVASTPSLQYLKSDLVSTVVISTLFSVGQADTQICISITKGPRFRLFTWEAVTSNKQAYLNITCTLA